MVTVRIQSAIPSQACLTESAAGRTLGVTPPTAPGDISACFVEARVEISAAAGTPPQVVTARLYPQSLGDGTGNVRYFYHNVRTVPGLLNTYFNPAIVQERTLLVQTSARLTYEIQLAQGLPVLRNAIAARAVSPVAISDGQYSSLVPDLLNYLTLVGEGRDAQDQAFRERLFVGDLYSPGALELVSLTAGGGIQNRGQAVLPSDTAGQAQARNLTTLATLFREIRHTLENVPTPATVQGEDPLNTALEYFDSPQGAPLRRFIVAVMSQVFGWEPSNPQALATLYRDRALQDALGGLGSRGVSLEGLLMRSGAPYLLTGVYYVIRERPAPAPGAPTPPAPTARLTEPQQANFGQILRFIQHSAFTRMAEENITGAVDQSFALNGDFWNWNDSSPLIVLHGAFPTASFFANNRVNPFNTPQARVLIQTLVEQVFAALTIDATATPPHVALDITRLRSSFINPADSLDTRALKYLILLKLFGGRGQENLHTQLALPNGGGEDRINLEITPTVAELNRLYADLENSPRAVATPHPRTVYTPPPAAYTWPLRGAGVAGIGVGAGSFAVQDDPRLQQALRITGFTLGGAGIGAELCELGGRVFQRTPPTTGRVICPIVGALAGFGLSFLFDNNQPGTSTPAMTDPLLPHQQGGTPGAP